MFALRNSVAKAACVALLSAIALGISGCGTTYPWSLAMPIRYSTNVSLVDGHSTPVPLSVPPTEAVRTFLRLGSSSEHVAAIRWYVRPTRRPVGSVFDSLVPSGMWTVTYWSSPESQTIDTVDLAPGSSAKTWRYTKSGYPISVYQEDQAVLSRVLAGRRASVRFLSARGEQLSWWIVHFPNGSEGAIPLQHMGPVYVDGALLQQRLYPAQVVFGEARFALGSSLLK